MKMVEVLLQIHSPHGSEKIRTMILHPKSYHNLPHSRWEIFFFAKTSIFCILGFNTFGNMDRVVPRDDGNYYFLVFTY